MATLFADDELTGAVLGLVYADPSTGFGVVELEVEGVREPRRCAGPLSDLVEGQVVRLVGAWRNHERYGETFEATLYEQVVPTTFGGIAAFLHSERFREVPEAARDKVLTTFGAEAGAVLQDAPERLVTEAGLSAGEAEALVAAWEAGRAMAELTRICTPAGMGPKVIRAVHARFGPAAVTIARERPYALLEVERVGFAMADKLARAAGVGPVDPARLAAGAAAAVDAARRRHGHQLVPRDQVVVDAAQLLGTDAIAAAAGIEHAVADGLLATDEVVPRGAEGPVAVVAPPRSVRAETWLARELHRIASTPSRLALALGGHEPDEQLTAGQVEAVGLALSTTLTVLTGGPGTGKTRTVQEVVAAFEEIGASVALCAPTGRAAKRMEELVGRPATTIHRLLEARPMADGGFAFRYGKDEHLPFDVVIADEVSMCDTSLARSLVSAVDDGSHLLLVGDPDQLPSVGPGDVLRDLLAAGVPHVRLTEVHRQAAASRIVGLANEINTGAVGELRPADGDVFMGEERSRAAIVPRVVQAVADNATKHLGVAPEDVQVVAPMYKGPCGVDALNAALKERCNPPGRRKAVAGFHVGDRVLQTRNDPDLDVANGDIGTVVDVDPRAGTLRVGHARGEVTYDRQQAGDLTLAWAITVHKSQGGEWPVVVLVCDSSHRHMLRRPLLYTAATRAQQALVVIGQADALRRGASRDDDAVRVTGLAGRLRTLLAG